MPSTLASMQLLLCGRWGELILRAMASEEEASGMSADPAGFIAGAVRRRLCPKNFHDVFQSKKAPAAKMLEQMQEAEIYGLHPGAPKRPLRLAAEPDAPVCLFAAGNADLLARPSAGLLSRRRGGMAGTMAARALGERAGWNVFVPVAAARGVRGDASGGACIASALESGGSCVAVLEIPLAAFLSGRDCGGLVPEEADMLRRACAEGRACIAAPRLPDAPADGRAECEKTAPLIAALSDAVLASDLEMHAESFVPWDPDAPEADGGRQTLRLAVRSPMAVSNPEFQTARQVLLGTFRKPLFTCGRAEGALALPGDESAHGAVFRRAAMDSRACVDGIGWLNGNGAMPLAAPRAFGAAPDVNPFIDAAFLAGTKRLEREERLLARRRAPAFLRNAFMREEALAEKRKRSLAAPEAPDASGRLAERAAEMDRIDRLKADAEARRQDAERIRALKAAEAAAAAAPERKRKAKAKLPAEAAGEPAPMSAEIDSFFAGFAAPAEGMEPKAEEAPAVQDSARREAPSAGEKERAASGKGRGRKAGSLLAMLAMGAPSSDQENNAPKPPRLR